MRHALNVHPLWAVTYYVISSLYFHVSSLIRFVQIFYDSVSYKGEKMFRIA